MTTRLYPSRLVVLGSQVGNSLSPAIQRAALASAGIRITYDALDVSPEDLSVTIEEIRRERIGGNVTRPHKRAFHDACDVLTSIARRVGAVNTFWVEDGRLHGDNTDVEGFAASARDLVPQQITGLEVLVLGAGGAAAAVLAAIERWPGASAVIVSRNPARSALLVERYPGVARVEIDAHQAARRAGLIVNATPVGQHDDELPLEIAAVPRKAAVMDLVYRRGETPWIRALRANGNAARDGMAMLLEQGALSFMRWFGIEADRAAMRRALQ